MRTFKLYAIHKAHQTLITSFDNNDLSKIVTLLKASRKALKIIKENLFFAFIYNIIMIPVAAGVMYSTGILLNPMYAALAMTISSVTVVLNSLRLKKI